MKKSSTIVIFILSFALGTAAQEPTWRVFKTANKHLTVSVPADALVININKVIKFHSGGSKTSLDVLKQELFQPAEIVHATGSPFRSNDPFTTSESKFEGFTIKQFAREDSNGYAVYIHIGFVGDYYAFSATGKSKDDPIVVRFLSSILLNDKAPFAQSNSAPASAQLPEIMEKVRSSPIVEEAMAKKCEVPTDVTYPGKSAAGPIPARNDLSRPLTVLRYPNAFANFYYPGNPVVLRIVLKADGCVGAVKVIEGGRGTGTERAIKFLKEMRFLPPEVDGKPIDSELIWSNEEHWPTGARR